MAPEITHGNNDIPAKNPYKKKLKTHNTRRKFNELSARYFLNIRNIHTWVTEELFNGFSMFIIGPDDVLDPGSFSIIKYVLCATATRLSFGY